MLKLVCPDRTNYCFMSVTLNQPTDRMVLNNISWQTYQDLVRDLESEPGVRLTYDRGLLEIRMPLDPHEIYKKLIGRMIEALTEELGIEIRSLGSCTWNREDLLRGLEADQCYYVQNEQQVRGKLQIDLKQDPPPDLAIKVDITTSSLNQLDIYADLGVPEVWIYNGTTLAIYHLQNQRYDRCPVSPTFPQLPPAEIVRFLELALTMGETSWMRSFRQWLRETL